ncbi:unnamed protein product [Bursaphelenchus xylophilus]|uniref:(pine wood nematode) hypothetical protein n=1 Tax=Bursaphelenchus xylophilus TaxID=6326 RepID=A0A1I7RVU1_BURXY|nr:unnamed protein product [Bursaphelenchus xylophilus]CAG9082175.1 unnamed protein product [Bursaphelenchus xylophilus]
MSAPLLNSIIKTNGQDCLVRFRYDVWTHLFDFDEDLKIIYTDCMNVEVGDQVIYFLEPFEQTRITSNAQLESLLPSSGTVTLILRKWPNPVNVVTKDEIDKAEKALKPPKRKNAEDLYPDKINLGKSTMGAHRA